MALIDVHAKLSKLIEQVPGTWQWRQNVVAFLQFHRYNSHMLHLLHVAWAHANLATRP